jgi:hypothetical protein
MSCWSGTETTRRSLSGPAMVGSSLIQLDPKTKRDLWVLPMEGGRERKPIPFLHSEFNETFVNWPALLKKGSTRP